VELAARLAHIDAQGAALVRDALAAPGAAVPGCPDWDTDALLHHIGSVHAFWAWIVAQRVTDPTGWEPPERVGGAHHLAAWATAQRGALLDALDSTPPTTSVWTWAAHDRTAGFVSRWQVVEATVHRLDAAMAAGRTPPTSPAIEPALAVGVLDTVLEGACLDPDEPAPGGSVHLHCTDSPGEWLVTADRELRREHARGDVALRGPALDLVAVLHRRAALDTVEILGDHALAARFVG
jgi:uncharacterized protein (TIGR03083 family)